MTFKGKESDLTVQGSNKSVLHQVNSVTSTPQNSNHQYIRPGKQILPKQNNPVANLHHLYFKRLIHSLSNYSVGETMDNWTAPKYNFMPQTIVLSGSQKFTWCIPLSKREAKIRNQVGIFVLHKFGFNTSNW